MYVPDVSVKSVPGVEEYLVPPRVEFTISDRRNSGGSHYPSATLIVI